MLERHFLPRGRVQYSSLPLQWGERGAYPTGWQVTPEGSQGVSGVYLGVSRGDVGAHSQVTLKVYLRPPHEGFCEGSGTNSGSFGGWILVML